MLQGKYPLLIAIVLAVMAGAIAYSAIRARDYQVREGWGVEHILCAGQELDEGTELESEMISVCEIPERFITDSFLRVSDGQDKDQLVPYGQRLIVPLKKGDPLLFSHFETRQEYPFSDEIPTRARVVSLEVSERSAANQLIRPGDHVDVVGTFRDAEGKELIATTVLQNIIVMATGHTTGTSIRVAEEDRKYSHIALLVLPEEVELLALAEASGTLSLSLRNTKDIEIMTGDQKITRMETLFGGERARYLERRMDAFQRPRTIELCRGSDCSSAPLDPADNGPRRP